MSVLGTERARRTGRADWMWLVGIGALLLTVLVAVAVVDLNGPLVVWNSVLRRWHLVGAVLSLGFLGLFASWGIRLHSSCDGPARQRSPLRRIAIGALTGSCLAAGVLAFLYTAFSDLVTTYTVLSPPSADGCRVVVGEHSFLLLGSGSIYVLPAGGHLPREVNSYSADDGYQPITFQTYRMAWRDEVADLSIWGTKDQPVNYDPKQLTCG